MTTVEELLYDLRKTDEIASDFFFFLTSFLSEFDDSTLLIIFFI